MNDGQRVLSGESAHIERLGNLIAPSLRKATEDSYTYAAGLTDGSVVVFHCAEIMGDWVRLHSRLPGGFVLTMLRGPIGEQAAGMAGSLVFIGSPVFPRGLDVRLSDIVWCADNPSGEPFPAAE